MEWTNRRLIQLVLRPSERRAHDMTATFIFHLPFRRRGDCKRTIRELRQHHTLKANANVLIRS